jgi:GNAT superfamily N-acetyltransferase
VAREFSQPHDVYTVLRIDCDEFRSPTELPPGYEFVAEVPRDVERALLEPEFPHWRIPFERRLPGMRPDCVVAVAYEGETVGIVYVCDRNEFGQEGYSQGHYLYVRPEHRGKKLFTAMYTEMLRRSEQWGLKGMTYITDREGHREMYERWGARVVGVTPKAAVAAGEARPGEKPTSALRRLARRVRARLPRRG